MSPKSFLHRLGIKPIRNDRFSNRYERALESAKKSGSDAFDAMSVETIELLFADEQMALETLGSNFDRLPILWTGSPIAQCSTALLTRFEHVN